MPSSNKIMIEILNKLINKLFFQRIFKGLKKFKIKAFFTWKHHLFFQNRDTTSFIRVVAKKTSPDSSHCHGQVRSHQGPHTLVVSQSRPCVLTLGSQYVTAHSGNFSALLERETYNRVVHNIIIGRTLATLTIVGRAKLMQPFKPIKNIMSVAQHHRVYVQDL